MAIQGPAQGTAKAASGIDESLVQTLSDAEMSAEFAREIAIAGGKGVVLELIRRIPSAEFVPLQAESRTLAFIGHPGRGKTTSLVKVAVRCGLGTGTAIAGKG